MTELAPLLYLETRMAWHKCKRVLHQPARLTLWLIFIVWFATFLISRAERAGSGQYSLFLPDNTRLLYAFVPAVFLAIVGLQIRSGARRPPAAFAYPADARFLLGSRLRHTAVVFWLQFREAVFQGMRVFLGLFFLSWNFAASSGGFLSACVALLSTYVICFGLRLPVFLLQRRLPRVPLGFFGEALVAVGATSILYALALGVVSRNPTLGFIAAHTPVYPPGTWLVQALTGNVPSVIILIAAACGTIALGSLAARDVYPEIWEASSRLYSRRSFVASGRALWNREAWRVANSGELVPAPKVMQEVRSLSGDRAPRGALSLLWREWIALRRSAGGLRWPLFWIGAASAFGYLAGLAARGRSGLDIAVPLVAAANIIVIIGSQGTISLGNELRRPLFWLGDSRLRDRLTVWIAGASLRLAPPLVAGTIMAGIALQSPMVIVASGPVVILGLLLVQSIGVASYVALPGRHDMRGPGFMLRVLTTYTALGPPALAWSFVQMVTQHALAALCAGTSVALAEIWLLVLFSANHLAENAMAYAAAEEH